ncbi:3'(2'),5'-bisphosphate nucleotidase CysQ [Gloeobacter kilaueensis]|uniref:3'(2'),5'-bisphosphate nucleotidase CysQ n=1 Tax=Gloeobacter kilaueensis (strain ATCC BAA-2537 / CCAP 1431/1 / ULC 316 / JS1) TaxID=1183438 RepID=U5QN42_GLOK1|nr:3'(2'),5'-bisphosphate nucleotidase CysQ [Gloeobacter kilaueensis]AGY60326.1 3'(2'),5'-bisphosphate nucleotidase [Gloeobacter kilaueensis JS1]
MSDLTVTQSLVEQVVDLAHRAGRAILEVYESPDLGVEYKADESPLTRADLASNRVITAGLAQLTPPVPILSEEAKQLPYEKRRSWNQFWLVDPLDGTKEFIKRNGEFTVNIALVEAGEPVAGVVHSPVLGTTYWAARGIGAFKIKADGEEVPIRAGTANANTFKAVASRSHAGPETEGFLERLGQIKPVETTSSGSSLKLCLVAEGSADLYPRYGPTMEWDTGAAHAVVTQAGGSVTDLKGVPLQYNKENLLNPYFVVLGDFAPELRSQVLQIL